MQRIQRHRHGFTLVELLVVIAIIAVLAALGGWGIMATLQSRQRGNTEVTIRTLNKLLQDRWAKVIADAKKETPSPQVVALAGGPVLDPSGERAKVIWIKLRLMEAFPQRYAEVQAPNSVVASFIPVNAPNVTSKRKSHFAKYQNLLAGKAGGGAGESAACLLMALNTLQGDGVSVSDQVNYAVVTGDGANLDVQTLVDAWGNPLAFFRFPWNGATQQANPGKANTRNIRYADPIDTNGTLLNRTWYTAPSAVFGGVNNGPSLGLYVFNGASGSFSCPIGGPSPNSLTAPSFAYYTEPTIVSAGRDGFLDLAGDLSAIGSGATDNIYSFQLRGD